MTYKVIFNKWAYVEADSEDEAMDKAVDGDIVYEEEEPMEAAEVDVLFVEWYRILRTPEEFAATALGRRGLRYTSGRRKKKNEPFPV